MSGIYFQPNKEIAEYFINDMGEQLSNAQVSKIRDLMKEGESTWSRNKLSDGSKELTCQQREKAVKGYLYDVVLETVGKGKVIINPLGTTEFEAVNPDSTVNV